MIERRQHKRVEVSFWASLKHPLLGTITCDIQDMSISGVSIKLDEELNFFVMMELDVRIHGEGWDETMPALPVRVVRVQAQEIGLQFVESCEEIWAPQDDEFDLAQADLDLGVSAMAEQLGEQV
ncbi:MAG: hypothetical protein COA96_01425 [SAR86 cluster bacterium]|uniref:PilZ domain-containing protein n=1 Tax=SAR86 cluster bacterium TaxID=2030880 RepID=A0A2A5BB03_9GAMM|nr:MAG: hypothetical protein COA96_01425 [SAR86 cluster bacterium]